MRRLLMVVLFAFILATVLGATPAIAHAMPTQISGVWTWVPGDFYSTKIVGDVRSDPPMLNVFFAGDEYGTWSGALAGTSYDSFTGVGHPDGSLNAVIYADFNGTVAGHSGSMTMKIIVLGRPDGSMDGTWVIKDAEGGLAGLHGAGTWEATGDCIATYEGFVH